jgi:hypothetical protein
MKENDDENKKKSIIIFLIVHEINKTRVIPFQMTQAVVTLKKNFGFFFKRKKKDAG